MSIITYEIMESKLDTVKLMDEDLVIQEIESTINEFNLSIGLKTTLSTMSGSIHYHLKNEKLKGLLELTYWPKHKRLWVEIHKNRKNDWNEKMIKPFSVTLATKFSGRAVHKEK